MEPNTLLAAIEKLQGRFQSLNWELYGRTVHGRLEKLYRWPGGCDEDVLICVHKSAGIQEPFHRHDFFYFNYTWQGEYDSLSERCDHRITVRAHELYAGQPFAGHALCVHDDRETILIGVLIRRETFFKAFLPMLSANARLLRFFLAPSADSCSEEFLHFRLEDDSAIRSLLEIMTVEYAGQRPDTQAILKPLTLSFLMQVARQCAAQEPIPQRPSDQIVRFISEHPATVTLGEIAKQFSYHPNYISTMLRRDTGKSFSQLLLEQRMERAAALLKASSLPVSEIAAMLGYTNSSNFYKAFREYYHKPPRSLSDAAD